MKKQLAIIGGGPAGVCGALAAARRGIQTVLITNRPVLGGNSSSEIRVWSRGAVGAGNIYSEEMGIWGELKLTNLYRNPDCNPIFWDEVLLDAVLAEPNIELFLNTEIFELSLDGERIKEIHGNQLGSEKPFKLKQMCFWMQPGMERLVILQMCLITWEIPMLLPRKIIPPRNRSFWAVPFFFIRKKKIIRFLLYPRIMLMILIKYLTW